MTYRDRLWIWLAWRLPRGLVYWCYVRVAANATRREPHTTHETLSLLRALRDWERPQDVLDLLGEEKP